MKLSSMMNSAVPVADGALLVRDESGISVTFTEQAERLKNEALAGASFVLAVGDAASQQTAVMAQTELRRCLKAVEEARAACKEPVIALGRLIDAQAKSFKSDLETAELRVAKLIGDYQTLELAKVRAAEAARKLEEDKLEQARQAAISTATSHDEIEQINADFCDQQKALPTVVAPKSNGQVVREEWEVVVSNVWALARAHPGCVKIEPRMIEIKALLNAGVKVDGVTAKRVVVSSVRLAPELKAIEV